VNKLTLISSALLIAGGTQIAQAQPPGGRGQMPAMDFDAINTETEDSPDYLTEAEVNAFMQRMMANRAGGPGGAGGPPGGGQGGPRAGGPGGGAGGMFGRWDTDGDGKVTREEFQNRQAFGGRGGPGGPGGQGGPGAGQGQGQGQQGGGAPQN